MKEIQDTFPQKLWETFEWLHRHPELSLEEVETTARIQAELRQIPGVEQMELGLPTGALARITGKPEGPVLALRADIDALPIEEASGLGYASEHGGRMHACGHDFHTAVLLGAATLLAQRKERLCGSVVLLFQPAEEVAQGAAQVVKTGLFPRLKIQQIVALHTRSGLPVGTIAVAPGPFSASVDHFLCRITGSGGHGSAPQETLDPIPAAARLVGAFQEIVSRRVSPMDTAVVSVTRLSAGTSWNVIPDSAELEGTVRSFVPAVRQTVLETMQRLVRALEAEGYQAELQWLPGCPATENDAALAGLVRKTAEAEGFCVVPQEPDMSGEDFSFYQEQVPGVLFHIGTGGKYPGHNARFTVDEAALVPAAKLMADLAEAALRRWEAKP